MRRDRFEISSTEVCGAQSHCSAARVASSTRRSAWRRLVPNLTLEDFEVLDNTKPQPINVFENEPTPITTVVMIDTSGSMTASLELVKDGAEQFLLPLLPEDKAQVGEFSDKIKCHPGQFIENRDRLVYLLKNDLDFGYPTRLWDAVDESVDKLEPETGRRSQPDRGLKKLAEDTGGGYFELKRTADLNETFTRVAQELHSQYVLGSSPETLDGKVHKLDVRVKKAGMTARARKTYVAAAAGTQ